MRRVDRLGDDVAQVALDGRRRSAAPSTSKCSARSRSNARTTCSTCSSRPSPPHSSPRSARYPGASGSSTRSSSTPSIRTSSATRRQRLHQRIAQSPRDDDRRTRARRSPSSRTTGWSPPNPPTRPRRSSTRRLAGDAALEALAPLDAVRWFSQALELQERQLSGEDLVRCDLLIGLGKAQQLAGIPEERETLLEAAELARQADDTERLVRVAAGLARVRRSTTLTKLGSPRCKPHWIEWNVRAPTRARLLAALACELDPPRRGGGALGGGSRRHRPSDPRRPHRARGVDRDVRRPVGFRRLRRAGRVGEDRGRARRPSRRSTRCLHHAVPAPHGVARARRAGCHACGARRTGRTRRHAGLPYPRWQLALDPRARWRRRSVISPARKCWPTPRSRSPARVASARAWAPTAVSCSCSASCRGGSTSWLTSSSRRLPRCRRSNHCESRCS